MGLANRLVRPGEALAAATSFAHEIASRPQAALRSDRLSSYEQWSLALDEALANEYRHGMDTLRPARCSPDSTTTPPVDGAGAR